MPPVCLSQECTLEERILIHRTKCEVERNINFEHDHVILQRNSFLDYFPFSGCDNKLPKVMQFLLNVTLCSSSEKRADALKVACMNQIREENNFISKTGSFVRKYSTTYRMSMCVGTFFPNQNLKRKLNSNFKTSCFGPILHSDTSATKRSLFQMGIPQRMFN